MAYSELLLILPPFNLIPIAISLATCFAVLYAMKGILKIKKEDITSGKSSIISLVFAVWGVSIGALLISFIIMNIIGHNIPYFIPMYREMAMAGEDRTTPAIIYVVCQVLLYAVILPFSYFVFRRMVKNKTKRNRLFIALFVISVILWALFMCFAFRVF